MHHFFEAITNTSGDSLIGYFGRVIDPTTNNVVPIAADDNGTPIVTVSGVDNMASTDAYGNLDFYVAPGTYHLDIYAPNATSLILRVSNIAMNSTKGDKGDPGNTGDSGPASAYRASMAALQAATIADAVSFFDGDQWTYTTGDFSGLASFGVKLIVQANGVPLTQGAWVRNTQNRGVEPDNFKMAAEADYTNAGARLSKFCALTGATARFQTKAYPNLRLRINGTFNVEGHSATIQYLDIGTTIVGGQGQAYDAVPTAWLYDPDYTVTMYTLAAVNEGSRTITITDGPTRQVGDVMFLCGPPTVRSSSTANGDNYIPRDHEYVRIDSVQGNGVYGLQAPLKFSYTGKRAAFWTAGLALDCTISDLVVQSGPSDAYQNRVGSCFNTRLQRVHFRGKAGIGAATFAHDFTLEDCTGDGSYNGYSFARGCGNVTIRSVSGMYRSDSPPSEEIGLFIEESFTGTMTVEGYAWTGGAFIVNSLEHVLADGLRPSYRKIVLSKCRFDARKIKDSSAGGSPFQGGAATGLDVHLVDCYFGGTSKVPDSSQYPGGIPKALTWWAISAPFDTLYVSHCTFEDTANDGSPAWATGGNFGGKAYFEDNNTYIGCTPPLAKWTQRGVWAVLTGQLDQTKTPDLGGGFAQPAVRRPPNGFDVTFAGAVKLQGVPDPYDLTQLSTFYRPKTTKLVHFRGYNGDVAVTIPGQVGTNGIVTLYHINGANVLALDGVSYPTDF